LEFRRNEDDIHINKKNYINELIKKYGTSDYKSIGTPLDSNIKLNKSEGGSNEEKKLPYKKMMGALSYLSGSTRPDISFAMQ